MDLLNNAVIYIDNTNGNNEYTGHSPKHDGHGNGPVKTMVRVCEMLRIMRQSGLVHPVVVKIIGDCCLDETIQLTFDNVTFEGYDENARLIGGKS